MKTGKYIRTREIREKIKNSLIGRKTPIEIRKKISESLIGNKRSLGYKHSKETNEKNRISSTGKRPSLETLKKLSISKSGKNHPMYGKHHSLEARIKISNTTKGKGGNNWRGGITKTNRLIRSCFKYRQWISDIFTRDDFTCQNCGKRGCHLHAHHIKFFSLIIKENHIISLDQAFECEELWNINNGLSLCKICHKQIHEK